jgi:hypothetical protein
VLQANARVLSTHLLRPLRAGVPMLAAALVASLAAFALSGMIAQPAAPLSLIALRLLIAAVIGVPAMLWLRPVPGMLLDRPPAAASTLVQR